MLGSFDVKIEAAGIIALGEITAPEDVTITAKGGLISDANWDEQNVFAQRLILETTKPEKTETDQRIGHELDAIETNVRILTATTKEGGIFISELNELEKPTIKAGTRVADPPDAGQEPIGDDNVVLTVGGDLELKLIEAVGNSVKVVSSSGHILREAGSPEIKAKSAELEAAKGIGCLEKEDDFWNPYTIDAIKGQVETLIVKVTSPHAGIFYDNQAETLTDLSVTSPDGAVDISLGSGGYFRFDGGLTGTGGLYARKTGSITSLAFENTRGDLRLGALLLNANAVATFVASGDILQDPGAAIPSTRRRRP